MGMTRNPKIALLAGVPLFAHCSKRDLEEIAAIADEIDFPAGRTLTREGYGVVLAPDGQSALDRLRQGGVDLLLSDLKMPGLTGLELLKEIKSAWPKMRVIMLTSFDHARFVKAALAEGADGYMLKDASPEDLDQAIRVAMAGGGNVLSARAMRA